MNTGWKSLRNICYLKEEVCRFLKKKTRFEYFGNVCVITPRGLVGGR
jgi:hypothetical protein